MPLGNGWGFRVLHVLLSVHSGSFIWQLHLCEHIFYLQSEGSLALYQGYWCPSKMCRLDALTMPKKSSFPSMQVAAAVPGTDKTEHAGTGKQSHLISIKFL